MPHRIEQSLTREGKALSWAEVAAGLQNDAALRDQLTRAIADCPYEALFWETAPVSRDTQHLPFAFALKDSPPLALFEPDRHPFPGALIGPTPVATFANLSGDATLISPRKMASRSCYTHLAVFIRHGPPKQVHALWVAVGAAVEKTWFGRPDPFWVSTSGLGVPWLHVRIDRRPKYYTHEPFRTWPRPG